MCLSLAIKRTNSIVCVRVSSRDYSAGNNRDTPFRAGLINQIQAGRETFPRYQPADPGLILRPENPAPPVCVYAGDDTRTRLGIPHGTQATLD
jgi:hypothetical protein